MMGPTKMSIKFLSTPSVRRATPDNSILRIDYSVFLSTPSARRATDAATENKPKEEISIHALREEGDIQGGNEDAGILYFYPRPPRGGRPQQTAKESRAAKISIHALREEGD